jgi:hypothetical protein
VQRHGTPAHALEQAPARDLKQILADRLVCDTEFAGHLEAPQLSLAAQRAQDHRVTLGAN